MLRRALWQLDQVRWSPPVEETMQLPGNGLYGIEMSYKFVCVESGVRERRGENMGERTETDWGRRAKARERNENREMRTAQACVCVCVCVRAPLHDRRE